MLDLFPRFPEEFEAYVFVCPVEDLRTGPTSFRWPEFAAYWSLDPSGCERLSAAETARLGFSFICFTTKASGAAWDASVYAGLRKFHEGKRFDPESQDLAMHLGYPTFELSSDSEDGEVSDEEVEDELVSSLAAADDDYDESPVQEYGGQHWAQTQPDPYSLDQAQGVANMGPRIVEPGNGRVQAAWRRDAENDVSQKQKMFRSNIYDLLDLE
ncbi:hypothetical protein B0H19DRAFT_1151945 [Mycena capillaripes]|nr:hypothetical protein B0H19DRAFT_1151945 [Mycena capillaripes]